MARPSASSFLNRNEPPNTLFASEAFRDWAAYSVVLLEVDFPHRPLSEAQTAHNEALRERFGVQGFPTVLFLDTEGNVMGRSGYAPGGAEAWTQHAQTIVDSRPKPPVLETVEKLDDAIAKSKADSRPLLLMIHNSKNTRSDQAMSALRARGVSSPAPSATAPRAPQ